MKRERWAWTVPWLVGGFLTSFEIQLVDAIGESRATGVYLYLGVALGWAWYRLYPRPLVARLFPLMLVLGVLGLFSFAGGAGVGRFTPNDMTGLGVLIGLVLTEARREGGDWAHQRRTALTSRETMRELR